MKLLQFKKQIDPDTRVKDFYEEWAAEDQLEAVQLNRVRNLLEVAVGWKTEPTYLEVKANLELALSNELMLAWGFDAKAIVDLDAENLIGTHPSGTVRKITVNGVYEFKISEGGFDETILHKQ